MKSIVIAVWVVCIACFAIDSDATWFAVGRTIFWASAAAHVVEFFVFRKVFHEAGSPLMVHFRQTMLFGLFHIREVRAGLETRASEP